MTGYSRVPDPPARMMPFRCTSQASVGRWRQADRGGVHDRALAAARRRRACVPAPAGRGLRLPASAGASLRGLCGRGSAARARAGRSPALAASRAGASRGLPPRDPCGDGGGAGACAAGRPRARGGLGSAVSRDRLDAASSRPRPFRRPLARRSRRPPAGPWRFGACAAPGGLLGLQLGQVARERGRQLLGLVPAARRGPCPSCARRPGPG